MTNQMEPCACCSKLIDVYNTPHARTVRGKVDERTGVPYFEIDYWHTLCYEPGHPTANTDLPPELPT